MLLVWGKEIHINRIFKTLKKETCLALPGFHTLTGCNTTSQFQGKGKKSAWASWKVTDAFIAMTACPFQQLGQKSNIFTVLEWYTCLLYDKTTDLEKFNDLRRDLFSQKMSVNGKYPSHTGCTATAF